MSLDVTIVCQDMVCVCVSVCVYSERSRENQWTLMCAGYCSKRIAAHTEQMKRKNYDDNDNQAHNTE